MDQNASTPTPSSRVGSRNNDDIRYESSRDVFFDDNHDDAFDTRKSPAGTAKTCLTHSSHSPPIFAETTPKTLETLESLSNSSPGTPELFSKLHDLESQHSRLSECHSLGTDLDDETSFLSMESATGMILRHSSSPAAAVSQQRKKYVRIIGIPSTTGTSKTTPLRTSPSTKRSTSCDSDSVFERLYKDAQSKMERARRRSSDQYSVAASLRSYGSYYSTPNHLQRRLGYMPSMVSSQRFRKQKQQRHSAVSSSSSSAMTLPLGDNASVFERLYRNQPRSKPVMSPTPRPSSWRHSRPRPVSRHHPSSPKIQRAAAALSLQTWWRMSTARKNYHAVRVCIVVLQAAGRRYLCRHVLTVGKGIVVHDDSAAIRIQAWWRMATLWSEYETLHYCASVIQVAYRRYRAAVVGSTSSTSVLENGVGDKAKTRAAIKLQAWWRMTTLQCKFETLHFCAAVVQSAYRNHGEKSAKGSYVKASPRSVTLGPEKKESAILRIQAWWRMTSSQTTYETRQFCALAIQRTYRNHTCYARAKVAATTMIQSWWRMVQSRIAFETRQFCAATVQKSWREHLEHRSKHTDIFNKPEIVSNGSRTIQGAWRRYRCQKSYQQTQIMAVSLQAAYRGNLVRQRQLRMYEAALLVQTTWRGYRVRLRLKKLHAAATTIQAGIRRHQGQQYVHCYRQAEWAATLNAALSIQAFWRCHRARSKYREQCMAVSRIQSVARGRQHRREFAQVKEATIRIQSSARRHIALNHYSKFSIAARRVQAVWRSAIATHVLCVARSAAILIQSSVRGYLCREWFSRTIRAVHVLQGSIRAYLTRSRLWHSQTIARQLQSAWRGYKARLLLHDSRAAAIIIQAAQRGSACRLMLGAKRIETERNAAVLIQFIWRSFLVRDRFLRARCGASIVQASVRGRIQKRSFESIKTAAILLQAWVRGISGRRSTSKMLSAALRIQSEWRLYVSMTQLHVAKSAVAMIQAAARGYIQKRRFSLLVHCVTVLQARCRGRLVSRQDRLETNAAKQIQLMWRRTLAKLSFLRARQAVKVIQSAYRGQATRRRCVVVMKSVLTIQSECRKSILRRQQRQAATRIQVTWRRYTAESMLLDARAAAMIIQAAYRSRAMRRRYLRLAKAVLAIQAEHRVYLSWQRQQKHASILIQAACRKFLAVVLLSKARSAALMIQSTARMYTGRQHFNLLKKAVIAVQTHVRLHLVKSRMAEMRAAAILVQCNWRSCTMLRRFIVARTAARLIQAAFRCHVQNGQYRSLKDSAILCQTWTRRKLVLLARSKQSVAAARIQRAWAFCKTQRLLVRASCATVLLQAHSRGFIARSHFIRICSAASLIQCSIRKHHKSCRFRRQTGAATVIQSLVRKHRAIQLLQKSYSEYLAAICIQQQWKKGASYEEITYQIEKENASVALPSIQSQAPPNLQPPRRPASPAVAVKVVEHIGEHRVRVELCPITSLRQRHAARCIQSFVRRVVLSHDVFLPYSPAVCVRILDCVSKSRLHVELRPAPSLREHHAAKVIQSFARGDMKRRRKAIQQSDPEEQSIYDSILRDAEEEAEKEVEALLAGSTEVATPCIFRLASRARQVLILLGDGHSTPDNTNGTPVSGFEESSPVEEPSSSRKTLFPSLGFDSFLSPIKAVPQE